MRGSAIRVRGEMSVGNDFKKNIKKVGTKIVISNEVRYKRGT